MVEENPKILGLRVPPPCPLVHDTGPSLSCPVGSGSTGPETVPLQEVSRPLGRGVRDWDQVGTLNTLTPHPSFRKTSRN